MENTSGSGSKIILNETTKLDLFKSGRYIFRPQPNNGFWKDQDWINYLGDSNFLSFEVLERNKGDIPIVQTEFYQWMMSSNQDDLDSFENLISNYIHDSVCEGKGIGDLQYPALNTLGSVYQYFNIMNTNQNAKKLKR